MLFRSEALSFELAELETKAMKTSLKKLRGFAMHKNEAKERRDIRPLPKLDELAQASQVRYLLLLLLLLLSFFVCVLFGC